MNRSRMLKKMAVVGLSVVMVTTSTGVTYVAKAEETGKSGVSKQETVFVNLDALGKVDEITVSDWLKNVGSAKSISDVSSLTDIKNVKGEEKFTEKSDDKLNWQTKGADIYYQGTTKEELPISLEISYKMDGKEITPEELPGKSGKFEMTIKYINHSKKTVKINGEKTDIYVPFSVMTGAILPSENFSNIEIDNGKIVSDGDKNIVVGIAMPGLKESLDLEDSDNDIDLNLPDTVTITADAKDFKLGPTYTLATSEIVSDLDLDKISNAEDLNDSLDELTDASTKLVKGSRDLSNGIGELKSKSGEFGDGITQLSNGLKQLSSGAGTLEGGILQFTNGADTLSSGVKDYTNGAVTLANGVKDYTDGADSLSAGINKLAKATGQLPKKLQEMTTGMKAAKDGADSLVANTEKLKTGMGSITGGIEKVNGALTQIQGGMSGITDIMTASVSSIQVSLKSNKQLLATLTSLPAEQQAGIAGAVKDLQTNIATQEAIIQKMQQSGATEQITQAGKALNTLVQQTGKSGELQKGAKTMESGLSQLQTGQKTLQSGLGKLNEGVSMLSGGTGSLPDAVKQLKQGSDKLVANNSKLKKGANSLITAGKQLKGGAVKLSKNSGTLRKGASSLVLATNKLETGGNKLGSGKTQLLSGINKLSVGSKDLESGMSKFDKEGIHKLTDALDGKVQDLVERLKKISDVGKSYKSFTGIDKNMDGSVKFIIETKEIEKEE